MRLEIKPLLMAAFAAAALAGEDLPLGRIVERVAAGADPRQTYALYVPSAYTASRKWPILYCLDPMARGQVPVERFAAAAEKAGFILAGSNNSRNGPIGPVQEAIEALLIDTHQRLSIDDSRIYAAGFSGGARVALSWAGAGNIAGVVACGAGFGTPRIPDGTGYKIFATAGIDDFNYDEMYGMSLELNRRGVAHRFVEFEGGHDWLPQSLAGDVFDFFAGCIGPLAARPSQAHEKEAAKFQETLGKLQAAGDSDKRSMLHSLQKDAAKAVDSPERRVARRVTGGVYVGQIESGRGLMAKQDYAAAASAYEMATMARPESGAAWYALAVAQAGAGKTRGAMESLEKAAANGFRDAARVEQEPLLAPLRTKARYQAIVRSMRGD